MTEQPPNYRREFWRSRHHLWLALLTVGLGFASGEPLWLLLGLAGYAIGWIYLPDSSGFRRGIEKRRQALIDQAQQAELKAFEDQRTQLLTSLSNGRLERYRELETVCRDIRAASSETSSGELQLSLETRGRKLEELLWTFLRLLAIGQSLEVFLELEHREDVPRSMAEAEKQVADLESEISSASGATVPEARRKLLQSRRDRLDALRQRMARLADAKANFDLVRAEQERLVEQVKLIRADAISQRNAESLSARIDLSVEHLAETNRWLSELNEFKDLASGLPKAVQAPLPPILPAGQRESARPQRQHR